MTRTLTATEAKATPLALLDDAAAGETIEVAMQGKPVARLVLAVSPIGLRGRFTGVATTVAADDDDLLTTGVDWDAG